MLQGSSSVYHYRKNVSCLCCLLLLKECLNLHSISLPPGVQSYLHTDYAAPYNLIGSANIPVMFMHMETWGATNHWTGLDWTRIIKFVFTLIGMQLKAITFGYD